MALESLKNAWNVFSYFVATLLMSEHSWHVAVPLGHKTDWSSVY